MWLLALFAAAWAATPEDEIVAAFTPRHVTLACSEVATEWPADVRLGAFVAVAEGGALPPWVPIAAASCVAESAREPVAREAVERWIADPALAGLAVAAVGRLDALPAAVAEPLADRIVARGLADPRFASWVLPSLEASVHPTVRANARRLDASGRPPG